MGTRRLQPAGGGMGAWRPLCPMRMGSSSLMTCPDYPSPCFARRSRLAPEDIRVAHRTTVISCGEGLAVAPFGKKLLNATILYPVDSTRETGRELRHSERARSRLALPWIAGHPQDLRSAAEAIQQAPILVRPCGLGLPHTRQLGTAVQHCRRRGHAPWELLFARRLSRGTGTAIGGCSPAWAGR